MSAVKDLLLSTVESTMRERGIDIADGEAFDAIQDEILNATECGYVCKRCGNPSPMGVGYAVEGWLSAHASSSLTACECGYSRAAYSHTGFECGAL